ncbi:MAG TPA: TRAP transporter large permease subunit [Sandaracinaceae bacterium LLY-WYZ-13_1]|nr:TRAP transporter large permease subunit [Sandaracinaceae bacterium LLY-WYZ-13_1]
MTEAGQQGGGLSPRGKTIAFFVLLGLVLGLPWLGKAGILLAIILGCAVLGVPLFALIGIVTITCFLLWAEGMDSLNDLTILVERIRTLADNNTLLAVPLFMLSGAIMARGEISKRLIDFSKALIGWIPGGLAVSGVVACMLFAAISGSSPATVVAIGAMMGPTLVANGYQERFTHGLLTSSGSLGILIPPSIPMILYPLVNQSAGIETERLFAAGFGPGLVIGGILAGFCVYRGVVGKSKREVFELRTLGTSFVDGFWSIMFPVVILGGIYTGFFTVVEASAVSVIYAVVVEIWIHRALRTREVPKIVAETGIILGSLLVIMVAALSFSEFLEDQQIPQAAVAWIHSMDLEPWQFLLALNVLLLMVGMLMDILSAMFVFVPLLAPIAASMGVDPMHFGIIFIVNLEIGYLTPPVGLNLFVASTLFDKPLGHMIRSVGPFIVLMLAGLAVITYVPGVSVGLGNWIIGEETRGAAPTPTEPALPEALDDEPLGDEPADPEGMQSLEEMMQEAEEGGAGEDEGGVLSMEEMMQMAEEGEDPDAPAEDDEGDEPLDTDEPTPEELEDPDHVMSLEEMMEAAGD